MIVGISGKIGSGKDEIGKIINMLYNHPEINTKDSIYYLANDFKSDLPKWQIKKFADNLKDIACLLIGCTREQLEDREFKEKELGEEWWKYSMLVDGKVIIEPYLTGQVPKSCHSYEIIRMTPRLLLQILGTEAGRQIIHPNIWVNAVFANYIKKEYDNPGQPDYDWSNMDDMPKPQYPNWVITDVRFPNEVEAIKQRGGIVIRVNRNQMDDSSLKLEHASETALDNYEDWDYVIDNNGTIEELIEKVKTIIEHAKFN